jgi:transcription elongation factor Elf1
MQNLRPLFTHFSGAQNEPTARFRSNSRNQQQDSLTCPHCGTQSQAGGKVKNSWYALCKCGTYIQFCANVSEYYD